jgi:hypothetical protein
MPKDDDSITLISERLYERLKLCAKKMYVEKMGAGQKFGRDRPIKAVSGQEPTPHSTPSKAIFIDGERRSCRIPAHLPSTLPGLSRWPC